jgi:adenylate cyclase
MDMFLQEIEATVVVHDVKGFGVLAAQLGPVELGMELGRFYEFAAEHTTAAGGRIVKFVGDAVLSVFIGQDDYRGCALRSVLASLKDRERWLTDSTQRGRPMLDYTIGVSSGLVLAGDVGIPTMRSYDVLGQAVNFAFRLSALSASRGVTHLVTAATFEGARKPVPGIEVEGVEFMGKPLRLYRLDV